MNLAGKGTGGKGRLVSKDTSLFFAYLEQLQATEHVPANKLWVNELAKKCLTAG